MKTFAEIVAITAVGFFAGFGFWLAKGAFILICGAI